MVGCRPVPTIRMEPRNLLILFEVWYGELEWGSWQESVLGLHHFGCGGLWKKPKITVWGKSSYTRAGVLPVVVP